MLYDILPPLLFFMSLGGIIAVISRVLLRIRRQEFSAAVQSQGASTAPVDHHQLLHPAGKKVNLVTNRISLMAGQVKSTVAATRTLPSKLAARRQERQIKKTEVPSPLPAPTTVGQIKPPTSSWRERVSKIPSATTSRFSGLAQKLAALRPRRKEAAVLPPEAPTPKPAFRLSQVEAEVKPKAPAPQKSKPIPARPGPVAGKTIARMLRKHAPRPSVLDEAANAIAAGSYDTAENVLVPHLSRHPKDEAAYVLLGEVALKRRDWGEAKEIFQQAAELNPKDDVAWGGLGKACLKDGQLTRALESLQRAHNLNPENAIVLKNLLFLAERMDNKVLQRSVLEDLVVLKPDDKTYQEKLQLLSEKQPV